MSKPRVCIFTSVQGHRSISDAITQALEKKFEVCTYLERDAVYNLYLPFYQLFPGLFKVPFELGKLKQFMQFATQYFDERYFGKVKNFYDTHQPVACISTYFMYNPSLEKICHQHLTPFINVLTDPRTVHPFNVSGASTLYTVFDQKQQEFCEKYNPVGPYEEFGWFVRDQFEEKYEMPAVRESLKLDKDVFTILVSSGSDGTNIVAKIFPSLFNLPRPIQIIVACGNNKGLYKSVKALGTFLKKSKSKAKVIPLEFRTDMHKFMQAADIIVGKAGPNTLFEAVATETPFLAITHISGQEDGNLDIIREYKLGYVEENPFRASQLLHRILERPGQLKRFQPHLKAMADKNRHAKVKMVETVEKLIEK